MTETRDDVCWVCGGDGANTLCPRCGHRVCRDCFDEETQTCLECVEERVNSKARTKKVMLVGGLLMLIVGLSATAAGIVASIPTEGVTVAFPFIFGEVSPITAGAYSFIFFLTVAAASLLPWYIHTRAKPTSSNNEEVTIIEGNLLGGEHFERVEYVITAEMPKRLEKTILVETNGASIHLHSTSDKEFRRSYPIPEGHELEGLDYDYDEGYLVLRLHLVRIP
ncbi:MAG: Hsp20/alpha crystallin family protein [Candidatus Bathyarchaeia archaeon]